MKEIRSAFEKKVLSWPKVTKHMTFGCPSYQANGKTFAILVTNGVLVTRIDQTTDDVHVDLCQNGTNHVKQRNIEHWIRVPVMDKDEIDQIIPIVKKSSEIVLQEE